MITVDRIVCVNLSIGTVTVAVGGLYQYSRLGTAENAVIKVKLIGSV